MFKFAAMSQRNIYAVLVAGGSGTRMGSETPKQFLPLDGIPILQRTMMRFMEAVPGIRFVTVLPASHIDEWKRLCALNSFNCPQTMVAGGITRFHSVKNALERIPDGAIVMIHDGVRPFVSTDLLGRILEEMQSQRAVIPVTPVTDTLKLLGSDSEGVLREEGPAPQRSRLWGAQTPQTFLSEDIKEAYRQAFEKSFTDDASVASRKGIPLSFVQGERFNIKITTPEDLVFGEAILKCR